MTSQRRSLSSATPNPASDFAWRPLPTGGAVIVGFTNDAPEMVVPAEIEGRPVVAILECAFNHHNALRSLTLPASVEYFLESINDAPPSNAEFRPFGLFAFFRCTELSEILVAPENTRFRSIDGVLFTADGKTLALYPKGRSGAYAVPPGVERIAQYAFSDARLSSVALSDDVQRIDNSVFFGCNHLKTIEFGANSSLREIGAQAFERCASFANVAFPAPSPAANAAVSNAPTPVANAQFVININKDFQRIFFVSFRAPQSARRRSSDSADARKRQGANSVFSSGVRRPDVFNAGSTAATESPGRYNRQKR